MNHRPLLLGALVLLASTTGCACLQSIILKSVKGKDILAQLNAPPPPGQEPPFWPVDREVDEIFRNNLPDAYWDPTGALAILQQPGAVAKMRDAVVCVEKANNNLVESGCLEDLYTALGFAPPPADPDEATWKRELDVIRLQQNLSLGVRAAAAYYRAARSGPIENDAAAIEQGMARSIEGVIRYQQARPVARRRDRPVTALVMSGGAANGAFSAGAAWWLLSRLDACKTEAEARKAACARGGCSDRELRDLEAGCLSDRVDMAAGTSTGSLITVLVKDYFSDRENRRKRALDMLVQSYTCSINSDLYCARDTNLYELFSGKDKGLVRFDGIESKLNQYVDETTFKAPPEYIASSVDYDTGRILHQSSADPEDMPTVADLRLAVMASIVEPAMAEPVSHVGKFQGTLVDGGIRSGLPMTTPLQRGAERAVVLVNAPMEAVPLAGDPPNAGAILMRTLDLFTKQPVVGELHQAEQQLLVKRVSEYERCLERTRSAGWAHPPASFEDLCSGRAWPGPQGVPTPKQVITQPGPPLVKSIPNAYQGVWLFEHNVLPRELEQLAPGVSWKTLTQAGYQFEPKAMWNLFVLGALEGLEYCRQMSEVLGWHLAAGGGPGYCGDITSLTQALQPLRDYASTHCWQRKNDIRMCEK